MSSLQIEFWMMLKWEHSASEATADKWIILIFFMMGLSIGVHLLNLLTIPAIVMIYYFKRYKVTAWGTFWAFIIGCAITGITPPDPADPKKGIIKHNTFLVWKAGKVSDFELTFRYRIEKGNSGVQYRSKELAPGEFGPIISGYQADFEAGKTYKVAGWAPVAEGAKGEPIWDVVATYLRDIKTVKPVSLNLPKLKGVENNPGMA